MFVVTRSIIAVPYAKIKVGLTSGISMTIAMGIQADLRYARAYRADTKVSTHVSLHSNSNDCIPRFTHDPPSTWQTSLHIERQKVLSRGRMVKPHRPFVGCRGMSVSLTLGVALATRWPTMRQGGVRPGELKWTTISVGLRTDMDSTFMWGCSIRGSMNRVALIM